jgi:hypothetical protein
LFFARPSLREGLVITLPWETVDILLNGGYQWTTARYTKIYQLAKIVGFI